MKFYRSRWPESRGDAFDAWGSSTWWFAVQGDDVRAHLEVCDHGPTLFYDEQHAEDPYGFRAVELPVEDMDEVPEEAFARAVAERPPANRVPVPLGRWGRITSPPGDAGSFLMVEVESGEGWKKPPPSDAVRVWVRDPNRPDDADANRTTWLHAEDVAHHLEDWEVEVSEWLVEGKEP